jgi:D-xylose transport system substrate-binding protein
MPHPIDRRLALAAVALLVLAVGVSACGSKSKSGGGGGSIALLLPETKTARYESQDRPLFTKKVTALCPSCQIIYSNADQDAAKQQQQAEAALTKGAKVLVLDPVDAASAGAIVARANQQKVPVISYDRLITGADIQYYVQFDSRKVGTIQGQALADKLKADGKPTGPIVMINGAPTDNNAKLFKSGAMTTLNAAGVKIAKQYDTPDWSPDKAQNEMQQAITAVGATGFVGVYAANDGVAGGAIAAMKGAGIKPSTKPTTGQDAELAAIQRILVGEQFMTVYKAVKPLADRAAEIAVLLAQGKPVPQNLTPTTEDNGKKKVPTSTHPITAVTKSNIKDTVIKDGYWTGRHQVAHRSRPAARASAAGSGTGERTQRK